MEDDNFHQKSAEISKYLLYQRIQIKVAFLNMISNFEDFLSVLKRCFIFMIAMSAKAVLPGLLKIKAF